mmetsp:Transcript_8637/g.20328  ORF Transcript_8637/g.20328 Transcript_8637/m.20328 type:complete len:224 (-) Transcript_8637:564-1235(-)
MKVLRHPCCCADGSGRHAELAARRPACRARQARHLSWTVGKEYAAVIWAAAGFDLTAQAGLVPSVETFLVTVAAGMVAATSPVGVGTGLAVTTKHLPEADPAAAIVLAGSGWPADAIAATDLAVVVDALVKAAAGAQAMGCMSGLTHVQRDNICPCQEQRSCQVPPPWKLPLLGQTWLAGLPSHGLAAAKVLPKDPVLAGWALVKASDPETLRCQIGTPATPA